jgi:EAL domain-containing protein (putative c-di-GMP-specific phosphodiesterase class I)
LGEDEKLDDCLLQMRKIMISKYLLQEIAAAMEDGELQAYYQPQYNAKKGLIGGAEALVRWVKPDGTVILPSEFIPILEKRGQVSLVDWFIAEEACKTILELKDKAVRISVNFGREHAKDKDFVKKLDALVSVYGIDKSLFGVEITETDVVADRQEVIDWAHAIESAGYLVSIDDFGSGMSSLSFVKDVPARILKIDRSFLNDNCLSERGRRTLESVFYFAHRLKLWTVVEGVETEEQLQFLNTCDCDYIQGFLFSRPVSREEFLTMCMEEAPVEVGAINPFENQSMFGQMKVLVESVYKKFPFIIYINLSKDSYQIMRKENYMDASMPETGRYDDSYELVKSQASIEDQKAIEEACSRENLLAAYHRGEERVVRIVNLTTPDGVVRRMALEYYFMKNPTNNDIYAVAFIHSVQFDDKTYVGDAK